MVERASLQAYSFPPKSPIKAVAPTPVSATSQSILSPLSKYTNISLISSPTAPASNSSSQLSGPLPLWQDVPSNSIFPSSADSVIQMPMMMSLPTNLPTTYISTSPAMSQSCALTFASTPGGSQIMQQQHQQSLAEGMFFDQQQEQMQYFGQAASMPQQPFNFGLAAQDFGFPPDFFDNLCV
jgi:hypothetical protein